MFLLSLQSNQEKVWKFPKFFTDTYWLEGELHYIKYLKEAFILRPIKLFYQCLLSVIKNFLKFKKKIKSSLRYFWKKCDLFTPLFSQKNLIRIQSLRYIFLVLSIPIWVQWWLKFSTPLWKNLLLFLMSWVTLVYPQCDPSFFGQFEFCFQKKFFLIFFRMKNNLEVHMRYHLFLRYGWFLQNLGKDFIPSIMHTTVCNSLLLVLYAQLLKIR